MRGKGLVTKYKINGIYFFPDVWSLGVILFMLVCGQAPFNEANDSETLIMIMDVKYAVPDHVSATCRRSVRAIVGCICP